MKKELAMLNISLPDTATKTASTNQRLIELLNDVKNRYPVLQGNRIILPDMQDEGYKISLYGTSNPAVIDRDGNVTQPLQDMTVNLFYRVTDTATGEALETDEPITVKIVGMYSGSRKNRPQIIPGIREWNGTGGDFRFSGNLVMSGTELLEAAQQVGLYIREMTGCEVFLSTAPAKSGDIVLLPDPSLSVGREGYTLEIDDTAVIRATSETGIIYGGTTISQMLMQSGSQLTMPKGMMRDYPQYEIRSFMIDTARYFMDIKYLEEVTKYAGFFKINQIHLHLNDGAGETGNSFRIKSDRYPSLNNGIINTCENGEEKLYTKDEFRIYQKAAAKYGIEVLPEIDAPSHCGVIVEASKSEQAKERGFRDVGINCWQLDLRDGAFENSVKFVQSVFDEFIDGENPVFCGSRLHFGTDEWIKDKDIDAYGITLTERNETMRKYMDAMIHYVNEKGYTPVLWNGMNSDGKAYSGNTPVSSKALFQTWSLDFSDINVALDREYEMVNSNDRDLYIVPGVTYYKTDLDLAAMYDNWEAWRFGAGAEVAEGHPLLKGAETAFWLDASCACSHIDVFKLLKNQIMLITEKTWSGQKTEGQTSADYMNRVAVCANYAPGANPGRYIRADHSGLIAAYDFSRTDGGSVPDCSGNGYTARIQGVSSQITEKALVLNGENWISLPMKTLSDPYRMEFDLCISDQTPANAKLFYGRDGVMYYNYNNTGKIAYKRKGYTYQLDCSLSLNKMLHFAITCDGKNTCLFADGILIASGTYIKGEYELDPGKIRTVYTFQIPLEQMFCGIKGEICSLRIFNSCVSHS